MDDAASKSTLRVRTRQFLASRARVRQPLLSALRTIKDRSWRAVLFGGVPRDLYLMGPATVPRDVDVVVENVATERIADVFKGHVRRRTRFGGLVLNFGGWRVDVWPLDTTWAFREQVVLKVDVAELPRTTFLDVEAIAVELASGPGRSRNVYERGFFDAMSRRVVEINLEENPYPDLCIVRSLLVASKIDFAIGPRLAGYIAFHSKKFDVDALVHAQAAHYGVVRRDADDLYRWLKAIWLHQKRGSRSPVKLEPAAWRQMDFWEGTNWEFARGVDSYSART
jgi:hypothetical protein